MNQEPNLSLITASEAYDLLQPRKPPSLDRCVSLFLEETSKQIQSATEMGETCIELNVAPFAPHGAPKFQKRIVDVLSDAGFNEAQFNEFPSHHDPDIKYYTLTFNWKPTDKEENQC